GNVLVMNGSRTGWAHVADEPVFDVEMYKPAENTFTTVAPMRVPRLYHSTAILLPDGRVMACGNDHDFQHAAIRLRGAAAGVLQPALHVPRSAAGHHQYASADCLRERIHRAHAECLLDRFRRIAAAGSGDPFVEHGPALRGPVNSVPHVTVD